MNREIRIDIGSAARAAEQSREAEAAERGEFKRTAGIRVTRAVGQKFELPGGPATGPGEALPVIPSAAAEPTAPAGPVTTEATGKAKSGGAALAARLAGAWKSLFRRGSKH